MLSEESTERFIHSLRRAFTEASELNNICNVIDYSDAHNPEEREYIQVGRKTWFPKAIIENGISNFNAEQIGRRLADGEVDAVLSGLSEQESIRSTSVDNLAVDEIISAVESIPSPDHIFIPSSDELWDSRWSWEDQGLVTYEEDSETLNIAGNQLEIHMLREESDIQDVYILDSDQVDVVQKTHDSALEPQGDEEWELYPQYNSGQPFMMYSDGEKTDPDDEDFPEKVMILYRIVFSTPSLGSENAVFRLNISD